MVAPEFIVPPPGLIPDAPEPRAQKPEDRAAEGADGVHHVDDGGGRPVEPLQPHTGSVPGATDRTVRAVPVRPLPGYTPLPSAPPSALVAQPNAAPLPAAPAPAPSAAPAPPALPTPSAVPSPPSMQAAPAPAAPPAELTMPPAFLPTATAPRPSAARFRLETPDGVEIELSDRCVLGRNPVAAGTNADARAVAVVDPTRTVSKTHALIEIREGRVIVTDLHSTNGVAVQAGGGEVTVLDAGAPAAVEPGSVLRLGDLALTLRRSAGLTV
ncbi:hypothetical protein BJ978_002941 [Agromyces terreus]|uniref:FHA domain-containing protein n=1 Tax=Agromyces terreus TaxID=424795 RepID=A0A9X2KDG4_9MICO|nr:FHA domain-containing protein [Agromyces terreus]MCP2372265.1 hypothetical protein [Agromyces terreus]